MKRLIVGASKVSFGKVIKSSTGFEILKLESENRNLALEIKTFLEENLDQISKLVERNYNGRANELSNYLETFLINYMKRQNKFEIYRPNNSSQHTQTAGYPDYIVKSKKSFIYAELKTYQDKTASSSLRSFYYKPSENNKITSSAPHILIGFNVESKGGENKSPFKIKGVKVLDLYNLKVTLKPEFNANNIDIYAGCEPI